MKPNWGVTDEEVAKKNRSIEYFMPNAVAWHRLKTV